MRRTFSGLLLAVPFLATGASAQSITNLGLAGTPIVGARNAVAKDAVAFVISESGQGLDLNGDGDLGDGVLHILRTDSGTTTNTGIAVRGSGSGLSRIQLGGRLCLATADEAAYGPAGSDLNLDGDVSDQVFAVYDLATGVRTTLGLAARPAEFGAGLRLTEGDDVLLPVQESGQGVDLNGDGDLADLVLHRWRAGSGTPINLGMAVVERVRNGGGTALFVAFELGQGADLNGDGDLQDYVVHALDLVTGVVTNLGLATTHLDSDGDLFAIVAREADAGPGTDWTGDGDANDYALFAYVGTSGSLRNLGSPVNLPSLSSAYLAVGGSRVAWAARETNAGAGIDWNGDGDAQDLVLHTFDARTGVTRNAGIAVPFDSAAYRPLFAGDLVFTLVSEASQGGADRNGDGDAQDLVAATFDARTGLVRSTGLASPPDAGTPVSSRAIVAFAVDEAAQGQQDLNGDGRISRIAASIDRPQGTTRVQPGPGPLTLGLRVLGDTIAFGVPEDGAGQDLNGDGDTNDIVLATWAGLAGPQTNQGLALAGSLFESTRSAIAFSVAEAGQAATDLNGDTDATDLVVHVLRP